ncbi:membrane protein YczE [Salinactinospora qingdaonensis]|uniref:Membrane protein YczE n=1 Tax=Salinactinospora qingdaonensis TaxID=702744 RepID=A0ABP7FIS5_9ACTN
MTQSGTFSLIRPLVRRGRATCARLAGRVLLTPVLPRPRARRLLQLYLGLYCYGLGGALQVASDLGAVPWDVFHQGLALHTPISIGGWSVLVGGALMLLWIPLRQRPGIGTLSNVVVIGVSLDLSLWLLPEPEGLPARVGLLVMGIVSIALATGCYIGAGLGPGPRDGLMTGLAQRGLSIRLARTCIEVTVVAIGFVLGGAVGVGTLAFALAIGPLTQLFLPLLRVESATMDDGTRS